MQPGNYKFVYLFTDNLQILKPGTHQELLSHRLLCLTALHMIGQSKMNERLHDMTSYC